MTDVVLKILCENVKTLNKEPIMVWHDDVLTEKDKEILQKEATAEGSFDKLHLKKNMYDAYVDGKAVAIVKKTDNARIVILGTKQVFPWNTWARIFQWMGKPTSNVWQIYIYASPEQRVLPNEGPIGPEHLNGGYTFPCRSDSIVIYREEESTRVLIHELLHSACTDNHSLPVEQKEAATETWAELFLIALLAKGNLKKAKELWRIQDHYIQDLNHSVRTFHNVNSPTDYGARYTIMREEVFERLGMMKDKNYKAKRSTISRFTSPQLDTYLSCYDINNYKK